MKGEQNELGLHSAATYLNFLFPLSRVVPSIFDSFYGLEVEAEQT
jgi:hypothetical protein